MVDCAQQLEAAAREIRKLFRDVKSRLLVAIAFFVFVFLLNSHRHQHQEMIYLQNSLSNLYKDFDSSIFTNASAVQEFMNQMSKLVAPTVKLEEIHKASKRIGGQIEILQNFEHDKTGRVDLVLANSGGRIAGLGANTQTFYSCNFLWKLIGCPNKVNGPEKLIQPLMHPGECFRFKGKEGTVYIRVVRKALLDAVTVEHITKKMSPTGEVTAAPRNFSVSGLNGRNDNPFLFGNFTFNANKTSIQTFDFPNRAPISHNFVQVDFLDNNGNQKETNVYRIRVHGVVDNSKIAQ